MLILVTTPIGNLGDMAPRAVEALQSADIVLCEDTRVTRKLSQRFSIETRLQPLHDHNEDRMTDKVLQLPLLYWAYKSESDAIRHIGPMAQDFHETFGVGANDVTNSRLHDKQAQWKMVRLLESTALLMSRL